MTARATCALLERLRAKDNAFDNAVLRYTKSEDWLPRDVSWRDPPGLAEKNEVKDQGPTVVKLRDHQQMVVRGRETTFISEADPEMERLNTARWVSPYRKCGVAEHGAISVMRVALYRGNVVVPAMWSATSGVFSDGCPPAMEMA